MPLSRRIFLRRSTLAALAAGCALSPGVKVFGRSPLGPSPARVSQIPYEAALSPVFDYTRETFAPYVGGSFRGTLNGSSVYLQLLRVSDYNPSAGTRLTTEQGQATRSFRLTFQAGRSLSNRTSVHQLQHAALGKFSLFMSRYINPRGHVYYEAVINNVA
jgi:hypothetical protein